jgi:antitoxin HicB
MFPLSYPVVLKRGPRDRRIVVTFPDLPEALTDGKDLNDALHEAADCLEEALACRISLREEIPVPTKRLKASHWVDVPLHLAPKVALYMTMRRQKVTNSELARRIKCRETIVRRMLNPKHHSKPERLQAALAALGQRVRVAVDDAA